MRANKTLLITANNLETVTQHLPFRLAMSKLMLIVFLVFVFHQACSFPWIYHLEKKAIFDLIPEGTKDMSYSYSSEECYGDKNGKCSPILKNMFQRFEAYSSLSDFESELKQKKLRAVESKHLAKIVIKQYFMNQKNRSKVSSENEEEGHSATTEEKISLISSHYLLDF